VSEAGGVAKWLGINISEGGTLGINISEGDMVVGWSGINVSEASWAARGFGI
jgi:hypothetical protein